MHDGVCATLNESGWMVGTIPKKKRVKRDTYRKKGNAMNNAMSINVDGSSGMMARMGRKLGAARDRANRTACLLDARMRTLASMQPSAESEKGAVTAEYAVVLVAATAFAAVLVAIVKSDAVRTLLTNIIQKALSVG